MLPLSAYNEDLFIMPNIQDYAYVKTIDSERALELMSELRNEYDESFDIGMPPQTDQYEANMMLHSQCVLDVLSYSNCSDFAGKYCQYNHDSSAASHKRICID